jgi:hypothetical protein
MRYISFKAVLLGCFVGIVLDALFGGVLMFTFAGDAFQQGISEAQSQQVFADALQRPSFLLASLVVGSITSVIAGYVSARLAKRLPYANSAAVGAIGLLLGLLLVDPSVPLWFHVMGLASVVPMALAGGHIAKQRQGGEA